MQQKYLEEIIHKYGHKLAEHANAIPGNFDKEDIHELRVNYKKLRAFIRLLQEDADSGKNLVIPDSIKNVYQAAAEVRDRQLFLDFIHDSIKNASEALPQFLSGINKELFVLKEKMVKEIENASFKDEEAKIKKHLPPFLHDEAIHRFVHRKIAAVQLILLSLENDEDLHGVRKHLKDLLYVIRVYQHEWGISFPIQAWKSEKVLDDLATSLGDYNDLSIAFTFLEALNYEIPEQEKSILIALKEKLARKKTSMQQELINKVSGLKLVSQFD